MHGMAWLGKARCGSATLGDAWHGVAQQGRAGQGKAGFIIAPIPEHYFKGEMAWEFKESQ